MALNRQTFRTRALTAAVFVIIMVGGLFLNKWSFILLFTVIHFGAWWEYLKLIEKIHKTFFHPYVRLGFMLIGFDIMLLLAGPDFRIGNYELSGNISLPVSAAGFALLVLGIFQKTPLKLKGFVTALCGVIYISLPLGLVLDLSSGRPAGWSFNPYYPVVILFCLWINDTMAYLVGSFIGKTPLSPISPKKTWEGTVGGILLCILLAFTVTWFTRYDAIQVAILAAVAAIAGTFGDLFESKLKRMAGVKDSGSIMPGHGGFLDRFDSLLFAVPACWLLLYFLL